MTRTEKRIEWKKKIDAWKASDLSVAAWCRAQDINPSQMYYWIRSFQDDKASKPAKETQWLTVDMKEEPLNFRSDDPVLIHFDSMSIEVRQGTDLALLSDVMDVLQNRC
jgi:transposase-like protein